MPLPPLKKEKGVYINKGYIVLHGRACCGLARIPHRGGYNYWLVGLFMSHPQKHAYAQKVFKKVEPNIDINWLPREVVTTCTWNATFDGLDEALSLTEATHRSTVFMLSKEWMTQMLQPYLMHRQTHRWLTSRFMPRRVPGAVQWYEPHRLWVYWAAL